MSLSSRTKSVIDTAKIGFSPGSIRDGQGGGYVFCRQSLWGLIHTGFMSCSQGAELVSQQPLWWWQSPQCPNRKCWDWYKISIPFPSPLVSPSHLYYRGLQCSSRHLFTGSRECGFWNLARPNCLTPSSLRGLTARISFAKVIYPFCCCHTAFKWPSQLAWSLYPSWVTY